MEGDCFGSTGMCCEFGLAVAGSVAVSPCRFESQEGSQYQIIYVGMEYERRGSQ